MLRRLRRSQQPLSQVTTYRGDSVSVLYTALQLSHRRFEVFSSLWMRLLRTRGAVRQEDFVRPRTANVQNDRIVGATIGTKLHGPLERRLASAVVHHRCRAEPRAKILCRPESRLVPPATDAAYQSDINMWTPSPELAEGKSRFALKKASHRLEQPRRHGRGSIRAGRRCLHLGVIEELACHQWSEKLPRRGNMDKVISTAAHSETSTFS
jgi:hypothetical protein